jgi:hypothetical protein
MNRIGTPPLGRCVSAVRSRVSLAVDGKLSRAPASPQAGASSGSGPWVARVAASDPRRPPERPLRSREASRKSLRRRGFGRGGVCRGAACVGSAAAGPPGVGGGGHHEANERTRRGRYGPDGRCGPDGPDGSDGPIGPVGLVGRRQQHQRETPRQPPPSTSANRHTNPDTSVGGTHSQRHQHILDRA